MMAVLALGAGVSIWLQATRRSRRLVAASSIVLASDIECRVLATRCAPYTPLASDTTVHNAFAQGRISGRLCERAMIRLRLSSDATMLVKVMR